MWTQDVWLTLVHSLVVARPEEDEVRDKIFPYQMHEVVWKLLGKLQGPESTEKRDPLDAICLASSSHCIPVGADSTALACTIN